VGPCDDVCTTGRRGGRTGWVEGFGTNFEKTGTLSNAAYDGHFAGTSFGLERKEGNLTRGFFGSWANHLVNGDGRAKGDWGTFGGYARVDRRQSFVEGSVTLGFGKYNLNRYVFIPGATFDGVGGPIVLDPMFRNAQAKTDAFNIAARLAGGRTLGVTSNGWTIGTRAETTLSRLSVDSYHESGAGILNLDVDKYGTTYWEGGLGLAAGKRFRMGTERYTATGKLMGMYGGVMGDDFSGRFTSYGSPFEVKAGHMSSLWLVPEANLAWHIADGVSLSGGYAGRVGNRYTENTGSVALHLSW